MLLKQTSTLRQCGRKRKVVVNKTEMMYIPLLDTLQAQLNNAAIYHEASFKLLQAMYNCSDHMEVDPQFLSDYCDGEHFKHHPLFSQSPSSLQIILYYDELDLCNPLGSRKQKHKIGTVNPEMLTFHLV